MMNFIPFILWLGVVLFFGGAIIKETAWYEKQAVRRLVTVMQVLTFIILAVMFTRDMLRD